jgi:predicted rRNA methylase YqxC with S4 and FtsJ domains
VGTQFAVMVKPQFEAGDASKHKGVIKNDKLRREILKDFEQWAAAHGFVVQDKADSDVAGAKGNRERFYLLHAAS